MSAYKMVRTMWPAYRDYAQSIAALLLLILLAFGAGYCLCMHNNYAALHGEKQ